MSISPNLEQVYEILNKAFDRFDNLKGLIFHSDQSWQHQYLDIIRGWKDATLYKVCHKEGNCLGKAMMEHFFSIMKTELLNVEKFEFSQDFRRTLEDYIE